MKASMFMGTCKKTKKMKPLKNTTCLEDKMNSATKSKTKLFWSVPKQEIRLGFVDKAVWLIFLSQFP